MNPRTWNRFFATQSQLEDPNQDLLGPFLKDTRAPLSPPSCENSLTVKRAKQPTSTRGSQQSSASPRRIDPMLYAETARGCKPLCLDKTKNSVSIPGQAGQNTPRSRAQYTKVCVLTDSSMRAESLHNGSSLSRSDCSPYKDYVLSAGTFWTQNHHMWSLRF